ncbi:hypothetical protein Misp01_82780 [Microtetraspora sp. NBRC 13810]|uniref:hypothetical protein n=1 Tax=Microtetraspora sp. NBRC 13810 TaxID=3030990 RepID=UPI0024A12B87|nr:hypothetical protein [Microtetraspora sp. NBRC 13810]GLW13150.1 hypothetical protein Misp01_82780 [Microtetraspora sp. NBRC 13810]
MAVPPLHSSSTVATGPAGVSGALRVSLARDVVLGLLIAVLLPLALVSVPNTISVVAGLLPPDLSAAGMIKAHGLALPAMVLTVPLAAWAVLRLPAAPVLVGGLALLAVAEAVGGYADSAALVGVLRVVHGVGAGLLIPASLMAVWRRAPVLKALWAASLASGLLAAQALALWPLDQVTSWRVTLQPYPMVTGVALVLAAVYMVLWLTGGGDDRPVAEAGERRRLLIAAAPAAGIALLALGAAGDWAFDLVNGVALVSVVALLVLASLGATAGEGGRPAAHAFVAVGVVVLPTAAQVTFVELGGLGGPGLSGLWLPFGVAVAVAAVAAILTGRVPERSSGRLPYLGLLAVVGGLCAVRLIVPVPQGGPLILPFALVAGGTAVALTAVLRTARTGAALFALALCFPAMLAGFLLGSGIQVPRVRTAGSPQAMVDAFVDSLHLWALAGGFILVAVIVLGAVLGRRRSAPGTHAAASGVPEVPRPAGPEWPGEDDDEDAGHDADWEGQPSAPELPSVPPPTPSPEGSPNGGHQER